MFPHLPTFVFHMKQVFHPGCSRLSIKPSTVADSYLSVVHLCVCDGERGGRRRGGAVVLLNVMLLLQSGRLIVDVCTRISIVD